MAQTEVERRTYTVDEAAKALGCGVHAMYDMVRRGDVAHFKVGRHIKIPVWAVDQYIERQIAENDVERIMSNRPAARQ